MEQQLKTFILDHIFNEIKDLNIQVHRGKSPPTLSTTFTSSNLKPAADNGWKADHTFEKCIVVGEEWLNRNFFK